MAVPERGGRMIHAEKDPHWDRVLYAYVWWSLRGHFHAVYADGMEHLEGLPEDRPALGFASHTNWWDGLMIHYLSRWQRRKSFYCMMEERQLQQYRFFRHLGAFSVDLENSLRAAAAVKYALNLLKLPESLLWVFPQGRLATVHEPLVVQPGAEFLVQRCPQARVIVLAMRYEFGREQKPLAFLKFSVVEVEGGRMVRGVQEELRRVVESLENDVRRGAWKDYRVLMKPRLSVNKRWDAVRLWLRGRGRELRPEN